MTLFSKLLPLLGAIELNFSPKTLGESLLLLAKGMLGIFVVIGAIILIVYILNKVTKKKEQ